MENVVTNSANEQLDVLSLLAPKWKRGINLIIDLIVITGILKLVSLTLESHEDLIQFWIFGITVFFMYFIFFETINGKTIGKIITRTKVVDNLMEVPSFKKACIRTICRNLPFEPISGFLGIPWHDSLSRTYVINDHPMQ
ncbi:MAG: RDD family protein [Bacteroidetes bacterium]|nr:RDD family protein [Bacteroidota bacterium]